MTDPKTFTGPGGWTFTPHGIGTARASVIISHPGAPLDHGFYIPLADLRAFVDDLDGVKEKAAAWDAMQRAKHGSTIFDAPFPPGSIAAGSARVDPPLVLAVGSEPGRVVEVSIDGAHRPECPWSGEAGASPADSRKHFPCKCGRAKP